MKVSTKAGVLAVVLLGAGIFMGAWSVIWVQRGSYLTALIMLGMTIWGIGFAAYLLCTMSGLTKPRTECGTTGTLLRPGRLVDALFIAPTAAVALSAALFLALSPLGMIDYVPSGVMRVSVPVGCVSLLLFGVPTLIRSVVHGGSGHLHLHPGGIGIWNGQWGTLRRASWGDVEQVLDHLLKGNKPFNEVIVLALPKGRSAVLMSDAITGDSATLREWVRFYWTHPESRDELVDDRGLRRLADKNFSAG